MCKEPILFYICETLITAPKKETAFDKIEVIQNKAMRISTPAVRSTSRPVFRGHGNNPVKCESQKVALILCKK
jgi:hypothetical protein